MAVKKKGAKRKQPKKKPVKRVVPVGPGEVPATAAEQLAYLCQVARSTGALHDAQVLHLRLWFLLCDQRVPANGYEIHYEDNVDEATIDSQNPRVRELKYVVLKASKEKISTHYDKLEEWVHWLLGDEVAVKVVAKNGKQAWPRI